MSSKQSVGHVKTFSAGLGSGAVTVSYEGETVSLPFSANVVRGPRTRLRPGDRIQLELDDSNDKLRVLSVELAPDDAGIEAAEAQPLPPAPEFTTIKVVAGQEIDARFTKENFVKHGSRLDFS